MDLIRKIARHTDLIKAMARKLGIDYGPLLAADPGTVSPYRAAVINCTRCEGVESCEKFLAQEGRAGEAPGFCRNKELLDRLAREADAEECCASTT